MTDTVTESRSRSEGCGVATCDGTVYRPGPCMSVCTVIKYCTVSCYRCIVRNSLTTPRGTSPHPHRRARCASVLCGYHARANDRRNDSPTTAITTVPMWCALCRFQVSSAARCIYYLSHPLFQDVSTMSCFAVYRYRANNVNARGLKSTKLWYFCHGIYKFSKAFSIRSACSRTARREVPPAYLDVFLGQETSTYPCKVKS